MSWQVKIIQQCHVVAQAIVAQVLVEILFLFKVKWKVILFFLHCPENECYKGSLI